MGLLNRFRKGNDHEAWLKAHPGKESMKAASASITDEEKDRMRAQMESEMASQRGNREA